MNMLNMAAPNLTTTSICCQEEYCIQAQRHEQNSRPVDSCPKQAKFDQQQAQQHSWSANCTCIANYNEKECIQRQVSGSSACSSMSEADYAVEYCCSSPTPELQVFNDSIVVEPAKQEAEGWFSKCRGCGCMTAHEQQFGGATVPFCRRCQCTLDSATPSMVVKMIDTLLYVHHAWTNAGF